MVTIPIFGAVDALPRALGLLYLQDVDVYEEAQYGVGIRYACPEEVARQFSEQMLQKLSLHPDASQFLPPIAFDLALLKADVYLYDLGRTRLPSDLQSDECRQLFYEAIDEVFFVAEQGQYEQLELLSIQTLPVGEAAPEWLWAVLRYRQAPRDGVRHTRDRVSHIALRVACGYIHKVRYTYPADFKLEAAYSTLLDFLQDWQAAVAQVTNPRSMRPDRRQMAWKATLPHAGGFFDPTYAPPRQATALDHYAAFGPDSSAEPDYRRRATVWHESNHLLLAALERQMALDPDYGGTARTFEAPTPNESQR